MAIYQELERKAAAILQIVGQYESLANNAGRAAGCDVGVVAGRGPQEVAELAVGSGVGQYGIRAQLTELLTGDSEQVEIVFGIMRPQTPAVLERARARRPTRSARVDKNVVQCDVTRIVEASCRFEDYLKGLHAVYGHSGRFPEFALVAFIIQINFNLFIII